MIVNKVLNITSDDVENQKDLQILLDWKRTLQNKINELKVRLEVARKEYQTLNSEENKSILIRTSDARNYNIAFLELLNARIKKLRNKNGLGDHIQNLRNFKAVAKEKLSEELYEEIKRLAIERTEKQANRSFEAKAIAISKTFTIFAMRYILTRRQRLAIYCCGHFYAYG